MNQIIFSYDYKKNIYSTNKQKSFFKSKKKLYFCFFVFSITTILIIFSYIIYNKYTIYKKNSNSNKMVNTYNISTLYSSNNNNNNNYYSSIQLSNNISIIGLIEIPNISIAYPILSQSNEELLKISVCRFSRSITKS